MRYQYRSLGYKNQFRNTNSSFPRGVKLLLIFNIVIFLMVEISGMQFELFYSNFGLVPAKFWSSLMLWQPVTYLFLHGGFFHLVFNMLVLWMFGKDLEDKWGLIPFMKYYFICGISSGIITTIVAWGSFVPIIGASGAIYGLLLAYGLTWPNRTVFLYGIFPVKVKFMVIIIGLIAFFASMTSTNSTTSHITHIGGMLVGLLYLYLKGNLAYMKLWVINYKINNLNKKIVRHKKTDTYHKKEVDKILEKLNNNGWENLSEVEQNMLYKASKRYSENKPPN